MIKSPQIIRIAQLNASEVNTCKRQWWDLAAAVSGRWSVVSGRWSVAGGLVVQVDGRVVG